MFKSLRDKLKKSIEKITKKVEEEAVVEKEAVEESKQLIKEKIGHKETASEDIEEFVKEPEIPEEPKPVVEVQPELGTSKAFIEEIKHKDAELAPKTKEKVKKRVLSITKKTISDEELGEVLWDLQVGLLENDVAVETAETICAKIKEDLSGDVVKRGHVEEAVKKAFADAVASVLQQEDVDLVKEIKKAKKPYKIVFLGFNGSGKTTTVARLAKLLEKNGLKCVLAAGDTWRAAAIQQLEKHGEALKIKVIKHDYGSDAAAVIFDAVKYAEANKIDVVLADTAGRAHTNKNLMDELHKVMRVNKPDKKILIVDSLTGNDAVEQARAFESSVGVDGIILTKMDVNEKGGAALSVAHTIKKPIYYIGVGQAYEDLEQYKPESVANAILS